jgi:hypothetical protein
MTPTSPQQAPEPVPLSGLMCWTNSDSNPHVAGKMPQATGIIVIPHIRDYPEYH